MGWGAERLARLGEAAWYLLITGAQRRGSPGTPARGVAPGVQGTAGFPRREGAAPLGRLPCSLRLLPLGCRRGGI